MSFVSFDRKDGDMALTRNFADCDGILETNPSSCNIREKLKLKEDNSYIPLAV